MPGLFGSRFSVPCLTIVKIESGAIHKLVSIVEDLLVGEGLLSVLGKFSAVFDLGDENFEGGGWIPLLVKFCVIVLKVLR